MQNKRTIFILILFFCSLISRAQDPSVIQNYINTYKDIAIEEMQRTGVPAAIKLAQGIHETLAGTSDLVLKSNNHFGIKCKDTWTGESVTHDDDLRGECFRKYASAEASYRDHSDFLKNSGRYNVLFNLDPTDYEGWAYGLKKAGYATNPRYPQIIIKLIEDYHLQDYTMIAMGKKPATDDAITTAVVKTETKSNTPSIKMEEPVKTGVTYIEEEKKTESVKTQASFVDKITKESLYPSGEFKLNETKVVYAKSGTSFLSIAEQYNLPLARIFEFNDMAQTETVNKDQLIYLQRKRKTGNNEFHIVEPGETLYDIAQAEALRIESLMEYNLLSNGMRPAIGEKLYLRIKASQAPRLMLKENYSLANITPPVVKTITTDHFIICTVLPKETIYAIAKKYNVKIDDIVKWNQLAGYDLRMGQELKIYK
jgi:flagellum-specific peptidoglycan hydrolase FlgJ